MNVASRPVNPGKTRTCPHCKATILESLTICPGCMHHLRFDSEAARRQVAATSALKVEGVIRHPPLEEPWEYYVVIAIRNDRGEEVTRQVVNVGALQGAEKRTFSLSVEMLPPKAPPSDEGERKAAANPTPAARSSGAGAPAPRAPAAPSPAAAPPSVPAGGTAGPPPTHKPLGPAGPYKLNPPGLRPPPDNGGKKR